jgi:hypothetical protein
MKSGVMRRDDVKHMQRMTLETREPIGVDPRRDD